ncbi:alpha/beta-hydrolase family protein [Paracoccus sp. CPCC 101403]|uniref:Alpha/beta-hydrolase family protein n=2 Tax=Paracoccus broussonetiae TaxID=3075834 RepID=A0ABU3E8L5_9RHOB|nr:alpha/beta-hydrolase family protein [Paracoccus sp. CPCC 101403]MDT1060554.1 alpha/beta-hydrolase family protein [Paracoccus sp. CPCC 101403]
MISVLPLLAGLLLAAASLTPSLIPRDWVMQGALAGISTAAGYLVTVFLLALWRTLQIPILSRKWAMICHSVLAVPVLALLVRCIALSDDWQNSIRERMQMPPLEAANTTKMLLLAAAVFLVLVVLGWTLQGLFNLLRNRLARYIPAASANVLGLLLAALIVVTITRDGVVNWALKVADSSYAAAQHLTDPSTAPPTEGWRSGGPGSLADWDLMGKPGRDFVLDGPRAAAIQAFTGRPAHEPLRIYVGLAQEKSAEARARVALAEMIRVGAFDRKILIVSSPTGTGWMDPASYDALEYMNDGDVATVAVQYSYLQSPLALIFETESGLEQATATMRAVYDHWRELPADARPRLYLHGISLGAWSSMYSMNPFQMMNEPISGAFWAGPPFPSELWRQANTARRPGSPFILPEVDEGEVIRYASQFAPPDRSGRPWGRLRILFLQHASDPIVFYNPASLWRAPEWMHEPPAPDVSPRLSFTPIVTQLQLAVDMLVSTSTPPGFGHIYDADEYIDGWVSITAPQGWTAEDTARLKAKCGKGGLIGCDNG